MIVAQTFNISVSGLKKIERKFNLLTGKEQKKVVRTAATKGMRPARAGAAKIVRTRAKDDTSGARNTGFFAKNIALVVRQYKSGVTVAIVAARNIKDPVTGENPAHIAHLLENGTKPHVIRAKSGKPLSNINDPRLALDDSAEPEVFGYVVQHPGTEGIHMFDKSFREHVNEAYDKYAGELSAGILKIVRTGT